MRLCKGTTEGPPSVRQLDGAFLSGHERLVAQPEITTQYQRAGMKRCLNAGTARVPVKRCELNRWMQHHLIEIICFRGGVYETRKTVWSFFGAEG